MARPDADLHGIVLVDKHAGVTSHDMVDLARRALGVRRIGHTGTLDPFATGLLPLLIGEAARLQHLFLHQGKVYQGEIRLGRETDSGDLTGKTVRELPREAWPPVDRARLEALIAEHFTGEIRQRPPAHSAIKVDGVRAYALARRGEAVELPERTVTLNTFTVDGFDGEGIRFTLACSSGTYVRSVAMDLGNALGIPAHLASLRRTRVGEIPVEKAVKADGIAPNAVLATDSFLNLEGRIDLDAVDPIWAGLRQGRRELIEGRFAKDGLWALGLDGKLIQMYEKRSGTPKLVFNRLR